MYAAGRKDARQALVEKIAEGFENGDSWLHYQLKGPRNNNVMQAVITHEGRPGIDHNHILESCSEQWSVQWQCNGNTQSIAESIKTALHESRINTHCTTPITPQRIILATKGFKQKTSIGGEYWMFTEIANLPDSVLGTLAELLNTCKTVQFPHGKPFSTCYPCCPNPKGIGQ